MPICKLLIKNAGSAADTKLMASVGLTCPPKFCFAKIVAGKPTVCGNLIINEKTPTYE